MTRIMVFMFALIALACYSNAEEESPHGFFGITSTISFSSIASASTIAPPNLTVGAKLHVFGYVAIDLSLMAISSMTPFIPVLANNLESGFGGTLGISWYFTPNTDFSVYLGPSLSFFENTDRSKNMTSMTLLALKIGCQYNFNEHLGIFTDIGFGVYSTKYWNAVTANLDQAFYSETLGNLVGLVFYF